jgi:N-acetylated-alpha-linked acidic dipeptidase
MRETTAVEQKIKAQGLYQLVTDTAKHLLPDTPKAAVPFINFSPLQNALMELHITTDSLDAMLQAASLKENGVATVNKLLYTAEQQLLLPDGLPRRPWYKHSIYAPGFYTGYGVKTLPKIREAIEQRNWAEAQQGVKDVADAVNRLNNRLQEILAYRK